MSKYEFQNSLKEAVLMKMEKQSAVLLLEGEKVEMGTSCPFFGSMEIPAEGLPCLVTRNSNREECRYEVAAVSLDWFQKEEKSWICLKPMLFEEAAGFFLENCLMEEIAGDYADSEGETVRRGTGPDFETGDAWIEINAPSVELDVADGGEVEIKSLLLSPQKISKYSSLLVMQQDEKRMIFLTVFQHGLNEKRQWFLCRKLSEAFDMVIDERTEFWVADMRLDADGITLVSYQNITDKVLLS